MSVFPKNRTRCPWPGLKPKPLPPGTSALTISPLCLVLKVSKKQKTVLSPLRSKHDWAVKLCTGVLVLYNHVKSSMFIRNDFSLLKIFPSRNIVSTVNLGCKLDLKKIALHARNAEYNPKV